MAAPPAAGGGGDVAQPPIPTSCPECWAPLEINDKIHLMECGHCYHEDCIMYLKTKPSIKRGRGDDLFQCGACGTPFTKEGIKLFVNQDNKATAVRERTKSLQKQVMDLNERVETVKKENSDQLKRLSNLNNRKAQLLKLVEERAPLESLELEKDRHDKVLGLRGWKDAVGSGSSDTMSASASCLVPQVELQSIRKMSTNQLKAFIRENRQKEQEVRQRVVVQLKKRDELKAQVEKERQKCGDLRKELKEYDAEAMMSSPTGQGGSRRSKRGRDGNSTLVMFESVDEAPTVAPTSLGAVFGGRGDDAGCAIELDDSDDDSTTAVVGATSGGPRLSGAGILHAKAKEQMEKLSSNNVENRNPLPNASDAKFQAELRLNQKK